MIQEFFGQLDETIARYDLLRHPFYQAWTRGELTREDLQEYAKDYYHQVESFPGCLALFARRLERSELREVVLANLRDELGYDDGCSHGQLWLDFAEGIGAGRSFLGHRPPFQVNKLIAFFKRVASEGAVEEALAAFYAYESQVPRVAAEKSRGLKERYQADHRTCGYFQLHMTADVYHARTWRNQLAKRLALNPETSHDALRAAEAAAQLLWDALDGIHGACLRRLSQVLQ